MKTSYLALAILTSIPVIALAQNTGTVIPGALTNSVQATDVAYSNVDKGANYRVWERTTYETLPSGRQVPHVHRYTELATGMHYQQNGQWMESTETIHPFAGGAVATNGQQRVIFSSDLNVTAAVDLQTSDGKRLRSHILGLSYLDAANGSNVWIGEIKSSLGVLQASNVVLYPDAFTNIKADVRYTYRKSGVEQDIILREQPPAPEAYGLNSQTTWLQVFTEFVDSPNPTIVQRRTRNTSSMDEDLDYGTMRIGQGKAFELGDEGSRDKVPVRKEFLTIDGRTFLVEEVLFSTVRTSLEKLPLHSQIKQARSFRMASNKRVLPNAFRSEVSRQPMKNAEPALSQKGYVLDYATLNTDTNDFTFKGNATYFLNGGVNISGTTTFEGGTVIKFSDSLDPDIYNYDLDFGGNGVLNCLGTINCQTAAYRPAVLTSMHDDSVGETVSGSSGSPSTLNITFLQSADNTLKYMRFTYANVGVLELGVHDTIYVRHCQFVNCNAAIAGFGNVTDLGNVLVAGGIGIELMESSDPIVMQNVTMSGVSSIVQFDSPAYPANISLTNCLFADGGGELSALESMADGGGIYAVEATVETGDDPFQQAGGGSYYLAGDSPYRNAGTANVDSTLVAELKTKTTYPPIIFTNKITVDTNLTIQAQRDTDTLDLGYHYDPLDYFASCLVTNAAVTLSNGVAVAYNYSDWSGGGGFWLQNGKTFTSQGTARQRNYIVHHSFVQEGPAPLWSGIYSYHTAQIAAMPFAFYHTDTNHHPSVVLQDTTVEIPPISAYLFYSYGGAHYYLTNLTLRDCEIYSGNVIALLYTPANYTFQNNLFVYPVLDVENSGHVTTHNNLFIGDANSAVYFANSGSAIWTNQDNAFDGCDTYVDDTANGTNGYNAYLNGAIIEDALYTNDIVTNLTWVAGPLGNYYQGADSPLINKGSRKADSAGLYHYTVLTDLVNGLQIKETNSTVDIGYHYVALDSSGNPIDSNTDGIPDYLEDANGNGIRDNSETNWSVAIYQQSTSLVVTQGQDAGFYVLASGIPTLQYQWYLNGSVVSGATNYLLALPLATTNQQGTYFVVVSNYSGVVTSSSPVLTVRVPPSIAWVSPTNDAVFSPGNSITNTVSATPYFTSVTNVQFYSAYGSLIGQTTNGVSGNYTIIWTNVPAGMYGLTAVATDGNGLSTTTSVQRITVGGFAFLRGINLNGTNVTIEGNSWWSYSYALTNGLSVTNCRPDSVVLTNWNPNAPGDTNLLFQTFLRRDRFLPLSQQTNYVFFTAGEYNPPFVSEFYIHLTNMPAGSVLTNTSPFDCGCYSGYPGWCLDPSRNFSSNGFTNSAYGSSRVWPCNLYYPYGSPNTNFATTNINMVNYVLNHKIYDPYDWGIRAFEIQDAIWYLLLGEYGFQHASTYGTTLDFTNMVAQALLFGPHFQPGNGQIALVIEDNGTNQPVGMELICGTNGTQVGFTLTLTNNFLNGTNYVFLWLAENQYDHARSLDIKLQGTIAATGIGDLLYTNWAKYGPYPAVVTNNVLTLDVISPFKGDPILMGLAIYKQGTSQPLSVQFSSPTNGELFLISPTNILLSATVSNSSGTITGVGFFNGATSLGNGTPVTNNIYSLIWTNVAASSNYVLWVKATNSLGTVASNSVSITVNAMPVVSIITPTNIQAYLEVTNVTLKAQAYDAEDGTNVIVNFYYTNSWIGTATNVTGTNLFVFVWTNRFPNYYPIVAVATDTRTASSASDLAMFKVTPTNPAPFVQISFPTNNAVFAPGSDITITAIAYGTNGSGTVTNVEFFVNGESIGKDADLPYSATKCCWKAGMYRLVAKATDDFGSSRVASQVNITIGEQSPVAGEGFWDADFVRLAMIDFAQFPYGFEWYSGAGIAADSSGHFYFGGQNYASTIRWDAVNGWLPMDIDYYRTFYRITTYGTNVYAIVESTTSSTPLIVHWDGTHWNQIGDLTGGQAYAISVIGGEVYIGGDFTTNDFGHDADVNLQYIAKLDINDDQWVSVGNGLDAAVYAIAGLESEIFIGGAFTNAGGNPQAKYIARLSRNAWTNLNQGVDLSAAITPPPTIDPYNFEPVSALAVCGDNLFVAGDFAVAGGDTNAHGVAVWSTNGWETIPGFPEPIDSSTRVRALAVKGERLFIGGQFASVFNGTNIVQANGIAMASRNEAEQSWIWSDLDGGVNLSDTSGKIYDLAIIEGDAGRYDLYLSGMFYTLGKTEQRSYNQTIARWRVGYPQVGPPTVTISNPPHSIILTNASIELRAIATSSSTNVAAAAFYTNGVALDGTSGPDNPTSNYNFTNQWVNPSPGVYLLKAWAKDQNDLIGESKPMAISIKDNGNQITALDDNYIVSENSPALTLRILTNDVSPSALKIRDIVHLENNLDTVAVSHDRTYIIFTPLPHVYGTDIFYYNVTNTSGYVDSASVTVKILAYPTVQITAPSDGDRFALSSSIWITNKARDYDGSVANVTLLTNGVFYKPFTTNSHGDFVTNWTTSVAGFYTLQAVATDNDGLMTTSAPVTVVITNTTANPNGPVAVIANLVATTNTTYSFKSVSLPTIRDGLFNLRGQASDADVGDSVSYAVVLYRPEDWQNFSENFSDVIASLEPYADVTPGPLNPQKFHIGGDSSGDLKTLDLTGIPDGVYDLVLRVRGGTDETNAIVRVQLDSQLKIGQFSFSEQDLVLPVNGIPLTVTRTYNSMNPRAGSFGQSWTYALNDMDVQLDDQRMDVTIGGNDIVAPWAENENSDNGLPKVVSIRTGGGWDVTLTLPDGRRTTFAFDYYGAWPELYAQWKAPPNVTAKLEMLGDNRIVFGYSGLTVPTWADSDFASGRAPLENQDIKGWILTTQDGTQYQITRGTANKVVYQDAPGDFVSARAYGSPKLEYIKQRSGDTIKIEDDGIFHYTNNAANPNRSILFERDGAGRITAIHDPISGANGLPTVKYIYHADNGNLLQVQRLADRAAGTYQTVKYHYDNSKFPHFITSIEDPRGIALARNEYDDSGKLTAVVDANGNRTEFIHSINNKMEVIIDRLNHTNTFVYDLHGNVTAQTNALGQVTLMAYDDNNNKTNEIVYLGNQPYATSSYVYDTTLNVVTSATDPLGHTSIFGYNTYGQLTNSIDALGHGTTNNYDPTTGNLISTIDALGNGSTNFFDGNSLVLGSVDAIGTRTTNFYDSSENLTGMATYAGATILSTNTFAYDLDGNRTNSVVWRRVGASWIGATNSYIYDAQNRVTQTIDPDGGTNTVVYNEIGKQQAIIDKLGHTTSYEYDFQGRRFRTTYPDTSTESSGYDAAGNCTTSVDRGSRITTFYYDSLNRVTDTVYADSTTNSTIYDGVGRVARTIDARGTITAFAYDAASRRLEVTNAVGTSVASTNFFGYDANGNQLYFTNALGIVTTNVFDVLNRQTQVLYPDGTKTGTAYDIVGRRMAETNQDSIVTWFAYDGVGRLAFVTNALTQVTRYEYDEAGNLLRQIDALGRTNAFSYDNLGRRVSHTMPDQTLVERFSYNLVGNLIRHTNFTGVVITNQYDALNRLTSRSSTGYQAGYAYNATGQRTNMVDASGTTDWLYDTRDRLTNKVVSFTSGPSITNFYRYDANGNLTHLWSGAANGVTNFYQYDALSRLTNVLGRDSVSAGYTFDGVGNLRTVNYGNGVTNLYQYDQLNRLTNAVWKLTTATVGSFFYKLNLSGARTNLDETVNGSRSYAWQYDPLYRMTNENISAMGALSYGYDAVGNRTNRTVSGSIGLAGQNFTFSTNDWLAGDLYDNNGNTRTNATSQPYFYDAVNQLTNFNDVIYLAYNGDGSRTIKSNATTHVVTYYLLDDRNPTGYSQVVEEYQGSTLTAVYTHGLNLVSQRVSGTVSYYIYDGHGSVRALTGTGGSVADTYQYDAYGTKLSTSAGSTANNYLYTGQQFDSDLGFYYLRARYYKPDTGRFWTMDTFEGNQEVPLSLHKYLYCSGGPVNGIDPSGHGETLNALMLSIGIAMTTQSLINYAYAPSKQHANDLIFNLATLPFGWSAGFKLLGVVKYEVNGLYQGVKSLKGIEAAAKEAIELQENAEVFARGEHLGGIIKRVQGLFQQAKAADLIAQNMKNGELIVAEVKETLNAGSIEQAFAQVNTTLSHIKTVNEASSTAHQCEKVFIAFKDIDSAKMAGYSIAKDTGQLLENGVPRLVNGIPVYVKNVTTFLKP